MKQLNLTELGGFKLDADNLNYLQTGFKEVLDAFANAFTRVGVGNFILQGCTAIYDDVQDKIFINPGYILVGGEICRTFLTEITDFNVDITLSSQWQASNSSTKADNTTLINEHRQLVGSFTQTASAANKTPLLLLKQIQEMPRLLDIVKDIAVDTPWVQAVITLGVTNESSTWQDAGVVKYCKTVAGHVKLAGSFRIPPNFADKVFTLPAGFRPVKRMWLHVLNNHSTKQYIYINTNGEVWQPHNDGSEVHVCLDGIEFDTLVTAANTGNTG